MPSLSVPRPRWTSCETSGRAAASARRSSLTVHVTPSVASSARIQSKSIDTRVFPTSRKSVRISL